MEKTDSGDLSDTYTLTENPADEGWPKPLSAPDLAEERSYILVAGRDEFHLSRAQLLMDAPSALTRHFIDVPAGATPTRLVLHREPALVALVVRYLRGYDIFPLYAPGAGAEGAETLRRNLALDAELLGLRRLRALLLMPASVPSVQAIHHAPRSLPTTPRAKERGDAHGRKSIVAGAAQRGTAALCAVFRCCLPHPKAPPPPPEDAGISMPWGFHVRIPPPQAADSSADDLGHGLSTTSMSTLREHCPRARSRASADTDYPVWRRRSSDLDTWATLLSGHEINPTVANEIDLRSRIAGMRRVRSHSMKVALAAPVWRRSLGLPSP